MRDKKPKENGTSPDTTFPCSTLLLHLPEQYRGRGNCVCRQSITAPFWCSSLLTSPYSSMGPLCRLQCFKNCSSMGAPWAVEKCLWSTSSLSSLILVFTLQFLRIFFLLLCFCSVLCFLKPLFCEAPPSLQSCPAVDPLKLAVSSIGPSPLLTEATPAT